MLQMSKRADYALLALSHLASAAEIDPNRLLNTKEIAEHYEIPVELLAKILQILGRSPSCTVPMDRMSASSLTAAPSGTH